MDSETAPKAPRVSPSGNLNLDPQTYSELWIGGLINGSTSFIRSMVVPVIFSGLYFLRFYLNEFAEPYLFVPVMILFIFLGVNNHVLFSVAKKMMRRYLGEIDTLEARVQELEAQTGSSPRPHAPSE
ncbi:hypothetical protein KKF84_16215 [Myxococcota bacterium]|nr:hypothetical protein [Myxococcota bacterium]MBU1536871.1 hypothetical protein [Myxococcota bacterium]